MRGVNRRTRVKGGFEQMGACKLAGDHLHTRPYGTNGAGDAAGKTATTERHEDRVKVACRSEQFEPDRAIAGKRCRIAHGIDVETLLVGKRADRDGAPPVLDRANLDMCAQAPQLLELACAAFAGTTAVAEIPRRR